MELRFRRFLLNSKRAKQGGDVANQDPPSSSSQASAPAWPVRIQSLSSNRVDEATIRVQDDEGLCSVPYDAVTAGKAPVFSSQPVKGNGPVKLSCRLSAGEVFTTIQDNKQVLDDILEGEYIVGGKGKRDFPNRQSRISGKSSTPPPTPALSMSQSFSESINSSRPSLRTPTSPWSPCLSEHPELPVPATPVSINDGPGLSTGCTGNLLPNHPKSTSHGLSDHHLGPRCSHVSTGTAPSFQNLDEHNATIAALWKAEYNRLVDLCGRENIEHKMPALGNGSSPPDVNSIASSKEYVRAVQVLDPLPYPNFDRSNNEARRSSNTSAASVYNDVNSDASSHKRVSLVSSCARSSSYTTQTSATDHEITVTREDIRKIVDQMRSTYIRALDGQTTTAPRSTRSAKKKRRRSKLGQSIVGHPVKISAMPVDQQKSHTNADGSTSGARNPNNRSRFNSPPIDGFGRLSTVDASPTHEGDSQTGRPILQRADSGTLGSLLAKGAQEDGHKAPAVETKSSSTIVPLNHTATPSLLPPFPNSTRHNACTESERIHLKTGYAMVSVQQIAIKPEGNFF